MIITATIGHSHLDGTLLHVEDLRPHPEARRAAKEAGFRWSANIGWYLPSSRDADLTVSKLAAITATLSFAGIEVEAEVDNQARSFEDKLDARTARSTNRADTLEAKARRHQTVAESHTKRSSGMAAMIPMGQPILAGHHSAPAHKRHLAKIRNQLDKASKAGSVAKQTKRRAASGRHDASRDSDGTFLVNRILEAERNKDLGTVEEIVDYMHNLGFRFVDPATIEVGQRWHVRRSHVRVVKVNRKTVTVQAIHSNGELIFPPSITNRIDLRYFHTAPATTGDATRQMTSG